MFVNSDFQQNYWSRTATGIFKTGHDCVQLMKFICYYDRSFYENINYYDMMASVCKFLNELSQR